MASPRILTFNFHEPYLCLMAKTGYKLTVGQYTSGHLRRPWQTQYRPIPRNVEIVDEFVWRQDLAANRFDVVIAHNESNAASILACAAPKLLVCHNRKTFLMTTAQVEKGDVKTVFEELLGRLRERFGFVFISASKRDDYGIPGAVILPGIDLDDFGGYTGDTAEVIRVGNMMRARNLMFDVDFQEAVCAGLPSRVVGSDPSIPNAVESTSFEDLVGLFRSRRALLHVSREAYEDGYNLAMLEAMATGMPVVSLANKTSPLTDGIDGFVSYDAAVLNGRLRELLADRAMAREIGARGRQTVAEKFPITAFVENWKRVIEEAAASSPRSVGRRTPAMASGGFRRNVAGDPSRVHILLHCVASPITTGRYFELAARKKHEVITTGLRLPEEVLAMWGFGPPYPRYRPQQIDLPLEGTCSEALGRLPSEFAPDLYLWIDSGPSKVPSDLAIHALPKACYLIDTHLEPELRLEMARHFNFTFLAQKAQVEPFREAGIPNVHWIPLACSPELHEVSPMPRIYDVAFVGSTDGDTNARRRRLLELIATRFPNIKVAHTWPEEMAKVYAQAKIVFNCCVKRDVNMRVFEAMAAGALLVTDEAEGLEDLFEDGKHLVVYRDDSELLEIIGRYLGDDAAREQIADAGRTLVLERHTYGHRLDEMLTIVRSKLEELGRPFAGQGGQADGYYANTRPDIAQRLPLGTERLLDVGCGCGAFGRAVKEQMGVREVHGIEVVEQACEQAKKVLDSALLGNVEQMELPFADGYFDCITLADVLEHLVDPLAALQRLLRVLADDGTIIISLPNVRFYQVIAMLGNGRWLYADSGIMDRTHLRFFTAVEMRNLVQDAGYEVVHMQPLSVMDPECVKRNPDGSIPLGRVTITPLDDDDFRDLVTFQYVIMAGKPGGDRLARARKALDEHNTAAAYALASGALGVDETEQARIRACAAARLGKLDSAEKLYRKALALSPDDPITMGELGILLVARNRVGDACPLLEQAHRLEPDNHRVTGALGLVYQAQERYADAFACYLAALDASYDSASLVPHLLAMAEKLERFAEVKELIGRFAAFYPGDPDAVLGYALVLAKLGMRRNAVLCLEEFLLMNPEHDGAQALLREYTEGH